MNRLPIQIALGVVVAATPASAIDVEKLVMPGPVIQGHADVEAKCGECHTPFRAQEQNDLCMRCHVEVARDRANAEGFHGREPGAANSDCRTCHTEHRGREADVVALDTEAFDHDFTDYRLDGAHRRVACARCHAGAAKFREALRECSDCHAEADVHGGTLGRRCGDCHTEQAWSEARFDHAKTRFPLRGRHRNVECALCHPGARYEETALACQSCHGLNDVHLGRLGADCARCHSVDGWKTTRFDHARDTKFPLNGGHLGTACESCHAGGHLEPRPDTACFSCHRADDEHRGRYGRRCEQCHNESSWRMPTFDHDRSTKFPLRGAHRSADCRACHTGTLYEERFAGTCNGCHRDDDVHQGQEGSECGACHDESGWKLEIFFEHDLTRFPLLGLHAISTCEQCHLTPRFRDARIECMACHEDDDVHLRRLGTACEQCHNPNGWRLWRFDHEVQTDFALRGAHAELECHACHRVPFAREARLPLDCGGCHARDDVHSGAFGRDCERCHADGAWNQVEVIR